jgi:beta-glucanase (GH16 family)
MMRKLKLPLLLTAMLALTGGVASAQNWQLVWQDEFNGSIGPDWVFETGAGGWGNNELEYYRQENATIENGQLVITAKKESFGGAAYTSSRMKTQGRKSWKYGKIEARIAMPSFAGSWPAFWMLGSNIGSVGWPACGEIDIMEHINAAADVHGTVHWADVNGNYASYGNATNVGVTAYHTYAIEWTPAYIRWFVDGAQYNEINILNNAGGTDEFQKDFFILLNFAIGGNWPGFTVDQNAFPAKYYVDYVRVYQDGGGTNNPSFTKTVEAETYGSSAGVQLETTTDTNGGQNVGYIDTGDWMAYNNIAIPTTGTYKIEYRVASQSGGGRLSLDVNAGATVLGYLDIPSTGGWQTWTTVSHTVSINAGTYNFGIYAQTGGFNLNWFRITKL